MSPVLASPVAFLELLMPPVTAGVRSVLETAGRAPSVGLLPFLSPCLEQGAALVVVSVVLATEAHHLEVSKQQGFCPLDLPHSLCGVVLCMHAICLAVTQIPNFQLPVALPTLNPTCDNQQCL